MNKHDIKFNLDMLAIDINTLDTFCEIMIDMDERIGNDFAHYVGCAKKHVNALREITGV